MIIQVILGAAASFVSSQGPGRMPGSQLLLLGTYHLANNNRDVVNTPIEDVLRPRRQREIATLVAALARWKPTRVAVEWPRADQAGLDRRYADYRSGKVLATANEREQIAFRLAARLNLPRLDAIDWNESAPGPDSAYAFDQWAKEHGQQARLEEFVGRAQRKANEEAALLRCTNIAQWYRALNEPVKRAALNRPYFEIATFGDNQRNPGAAWVGAWYARNLRIFNNLRELASPGARVFVLYGAGHAYLLEQFARTSGAFGVVDPQRFLPTRAGKKQCTQLVR